MTEQNALDDLKTPLFAALGAGDYAYEAVSDVVEKLRAAATDASKDFQTKVEEAQSKAQEAAGSAQAKLAEAADGLPKDVDELRARFTPEELRKVAAAYIQVATDIYESLAERGESAFARFTSGSAVEDAAAQATKAYNSAVELTESSLGQVAAATKQVGERAAKLVNRAADEAQAATSGSSEKSDAVKTAAAKADSAVKTAAAKTEAAVKNAAAKTEAAAKKATPAAPRGATPKPGEAK